jgi:hypothetical protein
MNVSERINWLIVKEILTCHLTHGVEFPEGVSSEDVDKVSEIAGTLWGILYRDEVLNRFGIGRMIREVLHDMRIDLEPSQEIFPYASDTAKMLLYSGHDSTLVPFLCALGVYDDKWPPYASFLTIEVAEALPHSEYVSSDSSSSSDAHKGKWVRAVYNDKDVSIPDLKGGVGAWYPAAEFYRRLNAFGMTKEDFHKQDADFKAAETIDEEVRKQMEAEVKATIMSEKAK